MRNGMKRVITILFALVALLSVESLMAQSRTSYFMEGSYFRTDMNPALVPTRGYLAVPAISGFGQSLTSNYLSVDNFVYRKDGELVTAFNSAVSPEEFLDRLPELGKMQEKLNVNLASVGFYKRRTFWSFGAGLHASANAAISKDLFTAVKTLGNGAYDLDRTAIDGTVYMDLYVGASFPVCKWVNVGIRGKALLGLADVGAEFDQLSANIGTDGVVGTLRGKWRGSIPSLENKYITPDGKLEYPDNINPDALGYILSTLRSFGAAIDLGVEVKLLNDQLRISAAVVDLGFIKWSSKTHIGGSIEGDFEYQGVDFETGEVMADGNLNTDNLIGLPSYNGYTKRLNCSVNVGVEYNILDNHIAFGLLSHNEFGNLFTYSELTASVNFRATNWLSATVSHTFLNGNKPGIFGAALNIHPAGVNLYIGVDFIDVNLVKYTRDIPEEMELPFPMNINPVYIPRYAKSLNVYFGFAFNFGRPKHLRVN